MGKETLQTQRRRNSALASKQLSQIEAASDKVLEMTQQGHKQHEIAEKLNINKSNVSRYVARARQEGKLRSCVV